jgi:beta-xylosidase
MHHRNLRPVYLSFTFLVTALNLSNKNLFAATPMQPPEKPIVNYPWLPDQNDGTYRNPIICADYSDPDVIRDGDDFYMTASSFNCTPGLPILHSRDLVNWTIINHAVNNLPDPRGLFDTPRHGEGVWAPAIRKHDNKFWIFFPMPDEGIYVTTAADPAGKWSEPHLLLEGKGLIDPCPLWDDDGKAYLVHAYARSRAGIKNILRVRPMSPDASTILGDGQIVYNDPENQPTLEGPKFHKFNGFYYISAPSGGVSTGWQLILRSKNVFGPYEPKTVLHQGNTPTNGPHQGAIVDTPSGQWWFIHFQEDEPYGRIIHLQPVQWKDNWPLMGINQDANEIGEPVLQYKKPNVTTKSEITAPQTTDEFADDTLGLHWQWHANHKDDWASLTARKGWLQLKPLATENDFTKEPNLLLQKFPAYAFSAETKLELTSTNPSIQAGLIVMGQKHAALVVARDGQSTKLTYLVNNTEEASESLPSATVRMRVEVKDRGQCTFNFAAPDGDFKPIGKPFQSVEGTWIGAKVGLFCRTLDPNQTNGHADFDYFRFMTN